MLVRFLQDMHVIHPFNAMQASHNMKRGHPWLLCFLDLPIQTQEQVLSSLLPKDLANLTSLHLMAVYSQLCNTISSASAHLSNIISKQLPTALLAPSLAPTTHSPHLSVISFDPSQNKNLTLEVLHTGLFSPLGGAQLVLTSGPLHQLFSSPWNTWKERALREAP